jgi:hypothetical protein
MPEIAAPESAHATEATKALIAVRPTAFPDTAGFWIFIIW